MWNTLAPAPARKNVRRARPRLEALEDRCTPAWIAWNGQGDGVSWHDALNWSGQAVPGAADSAKVSAAFPNVTIPAGVTATVGEVHVANRLTVAGALTVTQVGGDVGVLDQTGPLTLGAGAWLVLWGGTLRQQVSLGAGAAVNVVGTVDLADGLTVGGPGMVKLLRSMSVPQVNVGGHVQVGRLVNDGGTLAGPAGAVLTVQQMDWTGGALTGGATLAVPAGAGLTIERTYHPVELRGWTIDNRGTVDWKAGEVTNQGGVLHNRAEGVATFRAGATWRDLGGSRIDNAGQLTSSGWTTVEAALNNAGTVTAGGGMMGGSLILLGGGDWSGTYAADGAWSTIVLAQGTFNAQAGAQANGTGRLIIGQDGRQATVDTVAGTTTANANVELRAGGTIQGGGTFAVAGPMDWTGGLMRGFGTTRINVGGTLNINGTVRCENRLIENRGTATLLNGRRLTLMRSVFDNIGTFYLQGNTRLSRDIVGQPPPRPLFINRGQLIKQQDGTAEFRPDLNSIGTIDVQKGELDLGGDCTFAGQITVAADTTLTLVYAGARADYQFQAGASVAGTGLVVFGGPAQVDQPPPPLPPTVWRTSLVLGVDLRIPNFRFTTDGMIVGQNNSFSAGRFEWLAGVIKDCTVNVLASDWMQIGGEGDSTLLNSRLMNYGKVEWVGGDDLLLQEVTVIRTSGVGATFEVKNGQTMLDATLQPYFGVRPQFEILSGGKLSKTAGGATMIEARVTNTQGTVDTQGRHFGFLREYEATNATTLVGSGGALTVLGTFFQNGSAGATALGGGTLSATDVALSGGALDLGGGTCSARVQNTGGTIKGAGTINGDVTNDGVIVLAASGGAGNLTINGNFTNGAGATIQVQVGGTAAGQFDTLDVTGNVSLDGTVAVSLLNGFTPGALDIFVFLRYNGARNGVFATLSGTWTATYVNNSVTLRP